jgi:hypothetical protein
MVPSFVPECILRERYLNFVSESSLRECYLFFVSDCSLPERYYFASGSSLRDRYRYLSPIVVYVNDT